ncbi:MAG: cytochrome P450 [Pseudomonadota bacterium]
MTGIDPREDPKALVDGFNLASLPPAFYDDPFPVYAALQSLSPVHELPGGGLFLTRWEDLRTVYQQSALFSSDKKAAFRPVFGDTLLYQHHTTSLVFNDPPLHTRVRRLVAGALTSRAIAPMESTLDHLLDELLDRAQALGTIDAIDDFAAAIPIEIIASLMKIPPGERQPLRGWSLAILSALEPNPSEAMKQDAENAVRDFLAYLKTLIADRRRRPLDPDSDLLTRLIRGTGIRDGLTEIELLQNCIFILNAGHETTTNLVGNGLHLLLTRRPARDLLLQRPEVVKTAVEEVLRFASPNQLGNRVSTDHTTLGGRPVPAGTQITLCIGAANRDPAQFKNPNDFDITRTPNRHLAFISGPHMCAGQHLARLEGQLALARFFERFPHAELAGEPVRGKRARFRGFSSLPVELCPG